MHIVGELALEKMYVSPVPGVGFSVHGFLEIDPTVEVDLNVFPNPMTGYPEPRLTVLNWPDSETGSTKTLRLDLTVEQAQEVIDNWRRESPVVRSPVKELLAGTLWGRPPAIQERGSRVLLQPGDELIQACFREI